MERLFTGAREVRVRAYRQGFGDCFLLALPQGDGEPFYVMIDCGLLLAAPKQRIEAVVRNIIAATGGTVHLAVVTHEHWDHLSGFLDARSLFNDERGTDPEKLTIERVWLGWTEDPTNALAMRLREERGERVRALSALIESAPAGLGSAPMVENLLSFFGTDLAARQSRTSLALETVVGLARNEAEFLYPGGTPRTLAGVEGVRVYVLGPPENETLLKRSNPRTSASEVYEEKGLALSPELSFFAAAVGSNDEFATLARPFEVASLTPDEAGTDPFFRRTYFDETASWRRVEADWLEFSGELALRLDRDTNNTSLALAFELVPGGRVLLFPADAQVGNWLSWQDVEWANGVTANDLLERTVFYKVGHHGSHNSTLRDLGLERMRHPELIAMVPVDQGSAARQGWSRIPFAPLLDRLHEKTRGRVLRSDDGEALRDRPAPEGVTASVWQAFQDRVIDAGLYYEIPFPLD